MKKDVKENREVFGTGGWVVVVGLAVTIFGASAGPEYKGKAP